MLQFRSCKYDPSKVECVLFYFQGIKARVYETFVVLVLLVVVVTSIVWVTLGIVNSEYLFGTKDDRGRF